jgi:hypothetical protein
MQDPKVQKTYDENPTVNTNLFETPCHVEFGKRRGGRNIQHYGQINKKETDNKSNIIGEHETSENPGMPRSFGSSKGRKNIDVGAVRTKSSRHARQYMNRRGGFNRPLPAEKTGIKLNDF